MKYNYDEDIKLSMEPCEWNKNSDKSILQYAVGGLLYCPGTNQKIADDIINKRFDRLKAICLCLEDAIGDDVIKQAENCVKHTLRRIYDAVKNKEISINDVPLIFIRVRGPEHLARVFKVCGMRGTSMLTGYNLPKFDKSNCDAYINVFMDIQSKCKNKLYMMPIIESKLVLYRQNRDEQLTYINDKLKLVSDHVLNIRVGATDFSSIFGVRRNVKATIWDMQVISTCLVDVLNMFLHNYVCSGPVWEFFDSEGNEGLWSDGLKKELFLDRLNGFVGKTCIHPSQLKYVQQNNIVSFEEYKDALAILGMSDGIVGVKKGYGNNKMNEVKTHSYWARKIIGLAEVYGVLDEVKPCNDGVED